jgi:hypothetical protein
MASRNRKEQTAQFTASRVSGYSTERLSKRTWSDFERLFETHPAPGAHPCWCMYNHRSGTLPDKKEDSRAKQIERNRRQKKALVEQERSHGILVYAQGKPVGWCQYGLSQELPRIDSNPNYRKLASRNGRSAMEDNLLCGSQEISPTWSSAYRTKGSTGRHPK